MDMEGIGGGMIYSDFENDPSYKDHYEEGAYFDHGTNCTRENDWCGPFNETYYGNYTEEEIAITYSLGFKVAVIILYNSVFVTALLGNALVCYVVFSSPRMRSTTNYLIANLAVGDLLMAVLCVPFSYIPVLLQYWPFGHFLCYLLPPAQAIGVLVSSYTLVALAADRYLAILYPLRPRLRRSQACWVIAAVWLVAIVTASPTAVFTEYYLADNETGHYYCEESGWESMGVLEFKLPYGLTLMILQYFFPLTVLIFTYSRIAMAVWGKKSLGEAEDSRDQRLAKTKRKMIKMMLCVVIAYTTAWLPLNMFIVCVDIWGDQLLIQNRELVAYMYPIIHLLAMAHSVANPIIYCYMNSRFREGFRAAISKIPCLWKLVNSCRFRTRASSSGQLIDTSRRRSYFSTNRLTRTNTTCTTYTFGSGSLHNLHKTTTNYPYPHPVFQQNPLAVQRKHSTLLQPTIAASTRNGRCSTGSITVSQLPKPSHLRHHMSAPISVSPEQNQRGRNGVNLSTTMAALVPVRSSSSVPGSPSADTMVNLPMAPLPRGKTSIDLKSNKGHIQQQHTAKIVNGNGVIKASPSYVSISSKGGKDQVVTSAASNGSSIVRLGCATPTPSFRSQNRSSTSSGISESFM